MLITIDSKLVALESWVQSTALSEITKSIIDWSGVHPGVSDATEFIKKYEQLQDLVARNSDKLDYGYTDNHILKTLIDELRDRAFSVYKMQVTDGSAVQLCKLAVGDAIDWVLRIYEYEYQRLKKEFNE